MKKIYIIGGMRSGKSHLGRYISQKTGIKHFDLDELEFIEVGRNERNDNEKIKKLHEIITTDKWIIEGAYTEEWVLPALVQADIIIWLDVSVMVKFMRLIRQVVYEGRHGCKTFYGRGKLAIGLKHKKWDRSRACYRDLLTSFEDKVIVLKSKKDILKFVKTLPNMS